jgi:hypothetical protein
MSPEHVPPLSEECSVVLLGAFNPAIFHPEWFVRNKLFSEEALETAKVDAVTRNFAQFSLKEIRFTCEDSRLTVATSNMAHSESLYDALVGMLILLSHLPVTAVGLNNEAVFKVETEARWHRIGDQLAPKEQVWNSLCKAPGLAMLSIEAPIEDWDFPLTENLTVHPMPRRHPHHPAINVKTNLHFQIPSQEDEALTPTDMAKLFALENWTKVTRRARNVAAHIFEKIS